ncbi:MAG TPA: TIGR01777 family oxidoreductase [Cyclobacteriaceae bacterium]|nr:TIGR01777 family oxidoreductase [Cyclobacteriaceae bacterium]
MKVDRTILIGGGSGLIGSRLTQLLTQKGYQVRHLGREPKDGAVKTFGWDIHGQTLDEHAFEGVTAVINLAGANISGHRWTEAYKKELAASRTGSTKLLVDFLDNKPNNVKNFISGSAIGYYGFGSDKTWFRETDPPGNDFLAQLVASWEHEASKLKNERVKLAFVRTGIAFAREGGALEEMARPVRLFAGAPLGSGKQIVSWVHIDDLCGIFIHILENDLSGPFNGAAPDPASNERITQAIAKILHKPLWLPNIPAFVLKVVLGEMFESVINGSKISCDKIKATGFEYQFPMLESALNDTLNPQKNF